MSNTDENDREESFWGWGHADKFPDLEARRGLGQMAGALLGFGALSPEPAPRAEDLALRAPRVQAPAPLAEIASDAPVDRARHTYGRAYPDLVRGFRGDFAGAPDLVLRPRDDTEVAAALAWGEEAGVRIIPFGGGTSVVGGVEPDLPGGGDDPVISLDLGRLDRVLAVDETSRLARIQAGIRGPALERQLGARGLTLRHFPQSFEFSTLGGWIATRAGGHFATLYTHIDDLVCAVKMISPVGVTQTPVWPASGAGPEPVRLILGSEGILGVITEAHVRVRPRPRWRSRASVHFGDFAAGVEATRQLAQSGLHPANCRLLDAREAALHQVTMDGSNVLLLAFESASGPVRGALEAALDLARAAGGTLPTEAVHRTPGDDADENAGATEAWRSAFLDAPYLWNSMVSLGVVVDTFETCCTWSGFDALHAAVIRNVRAAMKAACGAGRITCRFTHVYPDGPAPYYTFLAPARRGEEIEQWRAIKAAASETLLEHGAAITHHHAVGRTHRPWHLRQTPATIRRALAACKAVFDPAGILNPGVLLDGAGERGDE